MRNAILILVSAVFLAGCVEVTNAPQPSNDRPTENTQPPPNQTGVRYFRSASDGVARYRSLSRQMEPRIEQICRSFHADQNRNFCDYQFKLISDTKQPPNAFLSLDNQRRPVITFTVNLLRSMANNDEIAFVIGHEAGHQIAEHIYKARDSTVAGSLAGAILAGVIGADPQSGADLGAFVGRRAYSKEWEFEADTIGAHIAYRAGYSPIAGIGYFRRNETGSNAFLATHPPSRERIRVVENTYNRIIQSGGNAPIRW
ncbi:MAG: M48 family metalloprotease [Pseudomonadota bacterium]